MVVDATQKQNREGHDSKEKRRNRNRCQADKFVRQNKKMFSMLRKSTYIRTHKHTHDKELLNGTCFYVNKEAGRGYKNSV